MSGYVSFCRGWCEKGLDSEVVISHSDDPEGNQPSDFIHVPTYTVDSTVEMKVKDIDQTLYFQPKIRTVERRLVGLESYRIMHLERERERDESCQPYRSILHFI